MTKQNLALLLINAGNVFFAVAIYSLTRALQMFDIDVYFWLAFGATLGCLSLGAATVHVGTRWLGLQS